MINHYAVSPILRAPHELRAPKDGGVYICLFAHMLDREWLDVLAKSNANTVETFLNEVQTFRHQGGVAFWKGGEVKANNRFYNRLNTLSSGVNIGDNKVPTAQKIHKRIVSEGGFALVMMIPVAGYSNEEDMMQYLTQEYGMEFDNRGRRANNSKLIRKRWLQSTPMLFTF